MNRLVVALPTTLTGLREPDYEKLESVDQIERDVLLDSKKTDVLSEMIVLGTSSDGMYSAVSIDIPAHIKPILSLYEPDNYGSVRSVTISSKDALNFKDIVNELMRESEMSFCITFSADLKDIGKSSQTLVLSDKGATKVYVSFDILIQFSCTYDSWSYASFIVEIDNRLKTVNANNVDKFIDSIIKGISPAHLRTWGLTRAEQAYNIALRSRDFFKPDKEEHPFKITDDEMRELLYNFFNKELIEQSGGKETLSRDALDVFIKIDTYAVVDASKEDSDLHTAFKYRYCRGDIPLREVYEIIEKRETNE